jgi:lambda family phage portal protein
MIVSAIISRARRALGISTRSYEAAGAGRRWRNVTEMVSPPAAALASRAAIMRRARGSYSNQAFARAIIDQWTASAIATGLKPCSKAPNGEEIDAAFSRWWDRADFDEATDFGGLQAALFRSMALTGDGLAALEIDGRGELRIRLLASEQVATVTTPDMAGGHWTVDGIEFGPDLRRAAVHLFKTPPGLPLPSPSLETIRLPIEDVVHMFRSDHVGVTRGISWISPVLKRLDDLDGTSDALVMRARVSAMFTGFMTDGDGQMLGPDSPTGDVAMEPGAMVRLRAGEGVEFASPPQIGAETSDFLKAIVRECAAGCGVPYELVSNDLSNANYSSLRGSMMAFRRAVEQVQYGVVIPQLRKIYRRWLTLEIFAGRIKADGFESNPEAWLAADWLCPKFAPVDPLKDSQAEILQIAAGLRSRRECVAERGRDLEELDAEIARDRASADALGLQFNLSTQATKSAEQTA